MAATSKIIRPHKPKGRRLSLPASVLADDSLRNDLHPASRRILAMRDLKLKPEFSLITMRQESLTRMSDGETASTFTKSMLLLRRITGTMLGGIGVTVLIGNLVISALLLFGEPAFILRLLAK
jgi:hypothetical protein